MNKTLEDIFKYVEAAQSEVEEISKRRASSLKAVAFHIVQAEKFLGKAMAHILIYKQEVNRNEID